MKKKILTSLMLSTVLVSQVAVLSSVKAETTDESSKTSRWGSN